MRSLINSIRQKRKIGIFGVSSMVLCLALIGIVLLIPSNTIAQADPASDALPDLRATISALETRVAALETQMADLVSSVETKEKISGETGSPVRVPTATPAPQNNNSADTPYEPILSDIEPYECIYDEFYDFDVCSSGSSDIWVDSTYGTEMLLEFFVVHPTSEEPLLKWLFMYTGDDWIFMESVIFVYGDQRYIADFSSYDRTTDVGSGYVLEGVELYVDSVDTLVDIAAAASVGVRFAGTEGAVDRELTLAERKRLIRILATYERHGGELPESAQALLEKVGSQVVTPIRGVANLRGGPGTDYDVVGAAEFGDQLEVVDTSDDGRWYQLNDDAWIFAELVEIVESN